MTGLRVIADDLTGALDSGCAFASERNPVLVNLPWRPLRTGPLVAVSTDTRDRAADFGEAAVASATRDLMGNDRDDALWFKKIDSVMRGNPIGETVAAYRAGDFGHCVVAPAFPDMGRITEGGQQYLRNGRTGDRTAVGPDLVAAFRAFGLVAETRRFDAGSRVLPMRDPAATISIIDATTQEQLACRIAALAGQIGRKPLWVGAGGLAAALSQERSIVSPPAIRTLIVGTRHATTLAQIEHARAANALRGADTHMGNEQLPVLLAPSLASRTAAETTTALRLLVPSIRISEPEETAVLVTGGDTLSTVLRTVGAEFLECIGEATTGVPVCRVRGGTWSGVTILSKSGGFGDEGLLTALLAR